jgi:hypothetical protein
VNRGRHGEESVTEELRVMVLYRVLLRILCKDNAKTLEEIVLSDKASVGIMLLMLVGFQVVPTM